MLPKLVITDIDGVLTDGGMYYDQTGNEWKKFNTSDSMGVLLCKALNIPVAIITSETTHIVERRAAKLKINHLIQGSSNKLADAEALCKKLNLTLDQVAYIGDDLIDLPLLERVYFSGAPANAPVYIKEKVHCVTQRAGGEGAFREFVETLLHREKILQKSIHAVLNKNTVPVDF